MSRELSTMPIEIYKTINIFFAGFFWQNRPQSCSVGRKIADTGLQDGYERNLVEQIRTWWKRHNDLCENMHRLKELKEKNIEKDKCRDKCSSCIFMLLRLLLFYSYCHYASGSAFADGDSATIWKIEK